jgi:tRNA A37 threonylcarbamoyladenosine dehydratase
MTAKLHLAEQCLRRDIRLISAMGTGNRLDPSALRVGDITQTAGTGCPLARIVRRQLRARGVDRLRWFIPWRRSAGVMAHLMSRAAIRPGAPLSSPAAPVF